MRCLSILIFLLCVNQGTSQINKNLGPSPLQVDPDIGIFTDVAAQNVGRISALTINPNDNNHYFAAAADGGVWESIDGGSSWNSITDNAPTTAIGSLAMDPSDDQVIYAGTGESNYANHSRYGLGILKSTDGGKNWSVLGADVFAGRSVAKIVINPNNSNIVYAAVTRAGGFPEMVAAKNHPQKNGLVGVFKSVDAGVTWAHLNQLPALSVSSLVMDPQDSDTLHAIVGRVFGSAENGFYKTTNGGNSWQFVSLRDAGFLGQVGRGTVSISVSDPSRLYAVFSNRASVNGSGSSLAGVFRSDDSGQSWQLQSTPQIYSSFGWYFSALKVDVVNPDIIYLGGINLIVSTNGGSTWADITPPHVDIHDIQQDSLGRLLVGDDGGVHRSNNMGLSWETLNNGISNVQFYAGLSLNLTDNNAIIGGTQDNGTNTNQSLEQSWLRILGGDGGWTQVDPQSNSYFVEFQGVSNLFKYQNGVYTRLDPAQTITGRVAFYGVHLLDPLNPQRLLYATERIHESLDQGQTWQAISDDLSQGSGAVRSMVMAPSNPNYIYAVTNDGNVQRSADGGRNFIKIADNIPGWPRITREITVHPEDHLQIYLAVSSFGTDQVRYSDNGGNDWQVLDGDLPDIPVNTIAVALNRDGDVLYAGTDAGVYVSVDNGNHWEKYEKSMPNVPVIDIIIENEHLFVATQGRGLWVLDEYEAAANSAFPSDFLTNIWASDTVQNQGILTTVLTNAGGDIPIRIDNSVMFTYTPDGLPIWLVMQAAIPSQSNSYELPIYMPTGNLNDSGQELLAIGIATKTRLSDDQESLLESQLQYEFDFTETAKVKLQESIGDSSFYDPVAFDNNPFNGVTKQIELSRLIPGGQQLNLYCDINSQPLLTATEPFEGRLNLVFGRDGQENLFGADFTYIKTVDAAGVEFNLLDDDDLATPTWYVYDNFTAASGFGPNRSSTNQVFSPIAGRGFLEETNGLPGPQSVGTDTSEVLLINNSTRLQIEKFNQASETMQITAPLASCFGFE